MNNREKVMLKVAEVTPYEAISSLSKAKDNKNWLVAGQGGLGGLAGALLGGAITQSPAGAGVGAGLGATAAILLAAAGRASAPKHLDTLTDAELKAWRPGLSLGQVISPYHAGRSAGETDIALGQNIGPAAHAFDDEVGSMDAFVKKYKLDPSVLNELNTFVPEAYNSADSMEGGDPSKTIDIDKGLSLVDTAWDKINAAIANNPKALKELPRYKGYVRNWLNGKEGYGE